MNSNARLVSLARKCFTYGIGCGIYTYISRYYTLYHKTTSSRERTSLSEERRIRRYYAISLFAGPSTTRNPRVIVETVDKTALYLCGLIYVTDLFKEYDIV